MVALGLSSRVQERRLDAEEPRTRVEQDMWTIVQQAERDSGPAQSETAGWYYWMPQPGVRYYCHELWPPPVARAGRPRGGAPAGR
jgi:hypothetical protein